MHSWGDENVDWAGIDAATRYIGTTLCFWRVNVRQWKEKYGTVRVYCSLGIGWWPQLTHPGHVWLRWPAWTKPIVYGRAFQWPLRVLNVFAVPFHKWLYRRVYAQAVARWPHLREEILCAADFPELLRDL